MHRNFEKKLSLYLRSERAMLDVFVRDQLRQLVFGSLGLIAFLTAFILLDIALFFTLQQYFPTHMTAFILAGSHVVLGLICVVFAKKKKHQQEVEALRDIRDFAKAEVSHDIKLAADDVIHMGKSVKTFTNDVSSIFSGEAFGLAGLIPIIQSILKRK
ncbi:MAG: hypothetical protein P1U39_02440 [Legionellaceae bacterium]|nr:hypothetical protein [Legionellaceae bacterium]